MKRQIWLTIVAMVYVFSGFSQSVHTMYTSADELMRKGELQKAALEFGKIIALGREYLPEAYYFRGNIHLQLKEYDKACSDLEKALKLRPDMVQIYSDLGWACIVSKRFETGLKVLIEGKKIDDEQFNLMLNLAHAYYLNNQTENAKDAYREVLVMMDKEEKFQSSFLADFDLLIGEKIKEDATTMKKWVTDYFNSGAKYYAVCNRFYAEAQQYRVNGRDLDAAIKYTQAAEAEEKTPKPRDKRLSNAYFGAGSSYYDLNDFTKAVPFYEKTIAIERKMAKGDALAYRLEYMYLLQQDLKNTVKADVYKKEWETELAKQKQIIEENNRVNAAAEEAYLAKDAVKGLNIVNEWYEKIKNSAKDQMIVPLICFRIIFNDMLGNNLAIVEDYEKIKRFVWKEKINDQIVLVTLPIVGNAFKKSGDFVNSLLAYNRAIQLAIQFKSQEYEAMSYSLLGQLYVDNYQLEKGLEQLDKGLNISELNSIHMLSSQIYNAKGQLYRRWGKFDQALESYNKVIDICQKIEKGEYKFISEGFKNQQGSTYDDNLLRENKRTEINTITLTGQIYKEWGKSKEAKDCFNKALGMAQQNAMRKQEVEALNSLGVMSFEDNNFSDALQLFNQAKTILEAENDLKGIMTTINNLAMVYYNTDNKEKCIGELEKVIEFSRRINDQQGIADALNNAGLVYLEHLGNYTKAQQYHNEALGIYQKLNLKPDIAFTRSQIGATLLTQGKTDEAIQNFSESISVFEELRLTAAGSVRRDYIARQIRTYRFLIDAYMSKGDYEGALNAFEVSKTKLLNEMLSGKGLPAKTPSIKDVQASLNPDQAVVLCANVDYAQWKTISVLVIKKNSVTGKQIPLKEFVEKTNLDYRTSITESLKNQRGLKKVYSSESKSAFVKTDDEFTTLINYFRSSLQNPSVDNQEFGKKLYTQLIKPIEPIIADCKSLIIVPDGILGLLPFETLTSDLGIYMAEKFTISYAQSLTTQAMIAGTRYPENRKPILAFGGAIYDPGLTTTQPLSTSAEITGLQNDFYSNPSGRYSMIVDYAKLGYKGWEDLPGSFEEVKQIEKTINRAEIVIEHKVSERYVKELSATGNLKNYKILHFATHGLVVPEIPELSALVMTQVRGEIFEDGYLRTEEIANLDIQADFVNLSACETGLGKVYGGEGVVGLTQSFLLAGAKSLSVSLWQVNDISTQKFMVDFYKEVANNKISFSNAIARVKNRFIKGDFGDEFKAAYYWAPFVFYGVDNQIDLALTGGNETITENGQKPAGSQTIEQSAATPKPKKTYGITSSYGYFSPEVAPPPVSISSQFPSDLLYDSRDQTTYKTLNINGLWWMAENLKFETGFGLKCHNNLAENCDNYGCLYTWDAATNSCPAGWRLPTRAEFDELIKFHGGMDKAKELLMKNGYSFNAVTYDNFTGCSFWSSSTELQDKAFILSIGGMTKVTHTFPILKTDYANVRCVKR